MRGHASSSPMASRKRGSTSEKLLHRRERRFPFSALIADKNGNFYARRSGSDPRGLLFQEAEFLIELADPAAAVDELLLAARPGRMGLGVDVEMERVALLAPGRPGLEFRAVGHHHI